MPKTAQSSAQGMPKLAYPIGLLETTDNHPCEGCKGACSPTKCEEMRRWAFPPTCYREEQ